MLYIEELKMLLSTGSSAWNHRQIVLWDPVSEHFASCWANDWNVSWHFNWYSQFLCRMTCQSLCMKKIWMALQEFFFLFMMQTLICSTWLERSYMLTYYNFISKKKKLLELATADWLCVSSSGWWEHPLFWAEHWETLRQLPDRIQISSATERTW